MYRGDVGRGRGGVGGRGEHRGRGDGEGEIDGELNGEGDFVSVVISVFIVELGVRRGDQSSRPLGVRGGRGGEVRAGGGEDGS